MSNIAHSYVVASYKNAPSLGRCGGFLTQSPQDAFHLPARRTSVPEARKRVSTLLREWGAAQQVRDDVELVVTELFTNAVRHTDSEKVGCEITLVGAHIRIEITDEGGPCVSAPHARPGTLDQEGGRGLLLVCALSESWGTRPDDSGRGQVVWADLPYQTAAH
ncbi:Anti-sigma regulatory factor (Ser/Thr protein kinase) [Streptomyces yunnanensis]|uniref:Anti-sigma regulatory factor (Ser/Thr protein kinase) n=1 Tax=Streptomyces yunnanensis TaxID=156453 RepID=A0A9X8N6V4_9ACTN|nr:Anti-sigma regulatory factor (Ser/Thr protein kinase) [Streptomyces yunnanensis]